MYKIYFNRGNSIFINSKIFFHRIKNYIYLQTLTKADEFDKSLIRTTTTKSILRPLPQYLLAVKKWERCSKREGKLFSLLPTAFRMNKIPFFEVLREEFFCLVIFCLNIRNGTKNVREQKNFKIEQKMLQIMFVNENLSKLNRKWS